MSDAKTISREGLLEIHNSLCHASRELMTRKNHDYAADNDVFRNFRYFGGLGILVRLSDKLARLRSFEENGEFKVTDEKLEDTILDLINYGVIYYAYKQETEPVKTFEEWVATAPCQECVPATRGPFCGECAGLAVFLHDNGSHWCPDCFTKKKLNLLQAKVI